MLRWRRKRRSDEQKKSELLGSAASKRSSITKGAAPIGSSVVLCCLRNKWCSWRIAGCCGTCCRHYLADSLELRICLCAYSNDNVDPLVAVHTHVSWTGRELGNLCDVWPADPHGIRPYKKSADVRRICDAADSVYNGLSGFPVGCRAGGSPNQMGAQGMAQYGGYPSAHSPLAANVSRKGMRNKCRHADTRAHPLRYPVKLQHVAVVALAARHSATLILHLRAHVAMAIIISYQVLLVQVAPWCRVARPCRSR